MRALATLVVLAVLSLAPVARADEARLDYEATAPDCPSESALRQAVAMRLGYDPFVASADRTVVVRITQTSTGIAATVEMRASTGESLGRRDLEDTGRCADLADVLVLAVSIAVDPARALAIESDAPTEAPPDVAETDEAVPDPVAADDDAIEAEPPPPDDPWRVGAGVSFFGEIGFAPSPTAGGSLDVRVRRGIGSIGLSVLGELPSGLDVGSGRVASYRAGATLVPCVHADFFAACALVSVTAIVGHGELVPISRERSAAMLSLGLRAQVGFTIERLVRIAGFVDVLATPTPVALAIDGQSVWSTGIVSGVIGASVSFEASVGR